MFKKACLAVVILGNILKKARELGIPGPRVYSHSLGYFLHEWGMDLRVPLEQDILFDGERAYFLAGRQTSFYLIK